jgi:iron complex outermembrane recepter protein
MRGVTRVAGCLAGIIAIGQSVPGRSAPVCATDSAGNVLCSGGAITTPITVYDAAAAFQPVNGGSDYTPANPKFPVTGYDPAPPAVTVTIGSTASFNLTANSAGVLADKGLIAANFSAVEDPAVNNVVINNAGWLSLTTSQIAKSAMHVIVSDGQVNSFTVNNSGTIALSQNFFGSTFDAAQLGVSSTGRFDIGTATYGGASLHLMSALFGSGGTGEFTLNNSGVVAAAGNYAAAYSGQADTTITNSGTIANTTWKPGDSIAAGHWAIATSGGADFETLPGTDPNGPLNVVSGLVKNANGTFGGTIAVADTSATAITNNASGVITGDILAVDTNPQLYAAATAGNANFPLTIRSANAGPRDTNIANYGLINGNFYLGSGTHVIDNAGGATINGSINVDQRPSAATFPVAEIYSTNPALNGTPLNGESAPNQLCARSTTVVGTYVGGQSLTLTNEGTLNGDIVINDQPGSVNAITLTGTGFSGNVIAQNGSGANSLTLSGVSNLASIQNFSAVDLQTSRVTVANGVSLVPNAMLATTIFGSGGTLQSPSLNLGTIFGALTLQGPATVVPTIGGIVHNGDVFQLASTVSGSAIAVDNASALVGFAADTSSGALLLKSSVLNPALVPGISNAGAAALNGLLSYAGDNPALQGLGAAVENLGALSDVRSAGEQLRPAVNGAAIMVPLGVSSLFQSQIDNRLDALYFNTMPAQRAMVAAPALGYADAPAKAGDTRLPAVPYAAVSGSGAAFWGNLVGAKIDQQTVAAVSGYGASTGGLILGADTALSNDIRIGGAFGYAASSIADSQLAGNNIGIETYQGMVYGSLTEPSWYLNASLGFAVENYTSSRRIVFPGFSDTAYASHNGALYLGRIDAGYPLWFGGLGVVPVASLAWGHLDQGGYTETGSAGAGLSVAGAHNDSVRSEIGVKSFLPLTLAPSVTATLGAHAQWLHEYGDVTQAVAAGFVGAGANFLAVGPTPPRNMADLGAELELARSNGGQSLTLSYQALLGSSFVQQAAMLRARIAFDADLDSGPSGQLPRHAAANQGVSWAALGFSDAAAGDNLAASGARTTRQASPWVQLERAGPLFAQADTSDLTLPEIRVIPTSPLAPPRRVSRPAPVTRPSAAPAPAAVETAPAPEPGAIDVDKVPANVQTLSRSDFDSTKTPNLLDALNRGIAGAALNDQTGNQFQLDLNYRGFIASPVIGTPQGLAVYQNGVRINEVFGDIVNWDFIPQDAINRLTLVPSNPVYGLNAIGGALSFEMKNGFTYQGAEGEVRGGSYGQIGTSMQADGQVGNLSGYITADAINDAGWRDDSPSRVRRVYADFGARGDQTEFHVTFTGADNSFGAAAATPVQMLNQNWASIYTIPQTTHNELAFLTASASWKPTNTLTYQANAYYRGYWQSHVDGNGTDASNDPTVCPEPALLCFPNLDGSFSNLVTTTGQTVANAGLLGSSVLGEVDRTWTSANSYGGSAQVASTEKLFGHDNNFVLGASVDRGLVQFTTTSELGTVNADQFPLVQGVGLFINQPSGDVAPVGLGAKTLYTGLYATDTFDVTSRLSLTAGGRFNVAQINLQDELGDDPGLTGSHQYSRFNPVVGATYKITPNINLYGGYSEANRAPTPLELECSDPVRPCLIDNALVGDPSLQQVVSHTFEAGLRGHFDLAKGKLDWSIGAFHTLNTNDIINVASPIPGHEFFQNGGNTLRRGVEADLSYKWDRWRAYANYTFVDATFEDPLTLSSPNNPFADANGSIFVVPGDHLSGIPDYRFKAGAEYQITDPWKFGVDLNVIGSQYLVGDESNQNPKVPAYWTVNLHSSYQLTKNVELFGLVKNLFNQHYYVNGTFFETDSFPYLNLTDPRTFVPGMPFAAYAGIRGKL